jgi:hypothetical protein
MDIECPGDVITYNCSIESNSENVQLTWEITLPDETSFTITHSNITMPNMDHLGTGITSVLTRYIKDEYIESLLHVTILQNVSMNGTQVVCRSEALDTETDIILINTSGNMIVVMYTLLSSVLSLF